MTLDFFAMLADLPYHTACAVQADYYEDHDLPIAAAFWRRRSRDAKPPPGALSQHEADYITVRTYPDRIEHDQDYWRPEGPPDIYPIGGLVHAERFFGWTTQGLLHLTFDYSGVHATPIPGFLPVYSLVGDDLPEAITEDGIHLTDGVFYTPRPAIKAFSGYAARTPIYLTVDGEAYVGDHLLGEGKDLDAEISYYSDFQTVLTVCLSRRDGTGFRRIRL